MKLSYVVICFQFIDFNSVLKNKSIEILIQVYRLHKGSRSTFLFCKLIEICLEQNNAKQFKIPIVLCEKQSLDKFSVLLICCSVWPPAHKRQYAQSIFCKVSIRYICYIPSGRSKENIARSVVLHYMWANM